MISYQQALNILESNKTFFGTEEVDLQNALDRVLSEDVFASRDFPPFNRSAMDGVALKFEDIQSGLKEFKILETIFAGSNHSKEIKTGECYKIMTGSSVPACADIVVRVEDTIEENGIIKILKRDYKLFQNIAKQGQDLSKGDIAINKGTRINISNIGLLASLGKSIIKVQKSPNVKIITTGNEVEDLDQKITATHIYNSNKYVIMALLQQLQIKSKNCVHVKDNIDAIEKAIIEGLDANILILTGGVSIGEADFIPHVLKKLGIQTLFYKVAIKPGKPVWCGISNNGTMVFALPGNPLACLTTFKLFVSFYINVCLENLTINFSNKAKLNFDRIKKSQLLEFFPALLTDGKIEKILINGSGDIRLGNNANILAIHPEAQNKINKDENIYYLSL